MSARNTQQGKIERRALRDSLKSNIPGVIDLVAWVKERSHVSTGMALKVIMSGALKVDSHTIGVREVKFGKDNSKSRKLLERYVPASYRERIEVVMPKELQDGA